MKVGIVGLPNVGKSTLFNILLDRLKAESSNFPFTTIEPNIGIVPVPDKRLKQLADIVKKKTNLSPPEVPATIKVVDIAGLIAGAHKGEGLGNKFLAHIREVDVIIEVIRVFDDKDVVQTNSRPDEDIDIIRTEFSLKDINSLEHQALSLNKKRFDKASQAKLKVIKKLSQQLSQTNKIDMNDFDLDSRKIISQLFLLSAKPIIYLFNLSETQLRNQKLIDNLKKTVPTGQKLIISCLKSEAQLIGMSPQDKKEYLSLINQTESAVDKLISLAYQELGLISFFTAGIKEVRAWPVKKGTLAIEAAGVIHTDFIKGFIKAKIVHFEDYFKYQSFNQAQEKGRLILAGKDYLIQDGDVIEFIVN